MKMHAQSRGANIPALALSAVLAAVGTATHQVASADTVDGVPQITYLGNYPAGDLRWAK
jgi:hypothetical protein